MSVNGVDLKMAWISIILDLKAVQKGDDLTTRGIYSPIFTSSRLCVKYIKYFNYLKRGMILQPGAHIHHWMAYT